MTHGRGAIVASAPGPVNFGTPARRLRAGRVVAAINVSAQDQRMPPDQMRKRLLPRLLESAANINTLMRMQD